MKIVVLGTRALGYKGLKAILEAGHEVVACATFDYDITEGYTSHDFVELCSSYNIPCWVTQNVNSHDFISWLLEQGAELGISLYWRRLIGPELIKALPMGVLNIHSSDLPKYRGFACHTWAIIRGEDYCGVTLHYIKPNEADSGDVALKRMIPITLQTTIDSLFDDINRVSIEMVLEYLQLLKNGKLIRCPMNLEEGFFSFPRLPRDGEINWSNSAQEIDRLIRGLTNPYPGAFTYYNRRKLLIWKASILVPCPSFIGMPGHIVGYNIDKPRGALVTTGAGMLVLEEVQYVDEPGSFNPADRWKSIQIRFGPCITDELMELHEQITKLNNRLEELEKRLVSQ